MELLVNDLHEVGLACARCMQLSHPTRHCQILRGPGRPLPQRAQSRRRSRTRYDLRQRPCMSCPCDRALRFAIGLALSATLDSGVCTMRLVWRPGMHVLRRCRRPLAVRPDTRTQPWLWMCRTLQYCAVHYLASLAQWQLSKRCQNVARNRLTAQIPVETFVMAGPRYG
jgi:hypothetical protein